jgi:hypothetical protein
MTCVQSTMSPFYGPSAGAPRGGSQNEPKTITPQLVELSPLSESCTLAEHYYTVLQAPHKELIWFTSGHSMTDADTGQFVHVMVDTVLAQTYK